MKDIITQDYKIKFHEYNIVEIVFAPEKNGEKKHIDLYNVPKLDREIRKHIKEKIYEEQFIVILNFENVDYIDSSGFGAIISTKHDLSKHNKQDTKIRVRNLSDSILRKFSVLGLLDKEVIII